MIVIKEIYKIYKLDLANSTLTLSRSTNGELVTIDLYNIRSLEEGYYPTDMSATYYIRVYSPINLNYTSKVFNPHDIDSVLTVNTQSEDEELEVHAIDYEDFHSIDTICMILTTPGVKLLPGCRIEILTEVDLRLVDGKFIQKNVNRIKTYINDQLLSEGEAL